MLRKGYELEVKVDYVRYPNIGIIDHPEGEIRVKGALKGEKVLIRISRKRKDYYQGKIVEVLEKSSDEIESKCPHFGVCGGCSYQNLSYEDELRYKEEQVRNLFKNTGLDANILKIKGSPSVENYRNKMEYTFGDEYKDGPLSLGMHRKGKFYEIEPVINCNISGGDFNEILKAVLEHFRNTSHKFYNRRNHKGFLRHLVVRKSETNGDILVNLVTSSQEDLDKGAFIQALLDLKLEGNIAGILHTINDNVADIIKVDKLDLLYGRDYLIEEVCGLKFKISPFSFFQTNTKAAEKLYYMVQDLMGDIEDQTVFDLYSGTGTIAQIMAKKAEKVIAIELIEEAVEMAKLNAKLNGLNNINFMAGDMFKIVDNIKERPDLIVIDPPRPGLENTLKKIIDFNPKSFIYVSCNPTTLARDLVGFKEAGYKIGDIHLLDQFPRTPHVEAICRLDKLEG